MASRLLFSALVSVGLLLVPGGHAQGQGVERSSASATAAAPRLPARVFSAELAARPDTPQAQDLAATLLKAIASRGSAKSLQRTLSGIKGTRLFSKAPVFTAASGSLTPDSPARGEVQSPEGKLPIVYVKLADGGVMGIIPAWQSVLRRTKEDNARRLALEALGFKVSRLVHQYVLAVWPQLKKDGLRATVQQPPATLSVGLSAAQVFTVLKGMGQNLAPFAKVGPDTMLAIASAGVSASGSGAMIFSKVPEGVRVSLDENASREGFVLMSDAAAAPEGDYLGSLRIAGSGTLNGKQFQVTVGSQSTLVTFPSEPPLVPPLAIGLFGGKNPGAGAASVSASAVGSIGVTCAAGLCVGQWSSYQGDGGPGRHDRPPLPDAERNRQICRQDAMQRWKDAVKTCGEGSEAAGCIADAGTELGYGLSACPELPNQVNHPCDLLGDVARTLAWELQRGCTEPANPVRGQGDNCPNMAQKLADLIAGKAKCDSRPCQEAAAAGADILNPIINRCSSALEVNTCGGTNTDWLSRVNLLIPICDEAVTPVSG